MAEPQQDIPSYQKYYFDNMEQQSQSTLFGMWLFMAQEILFFGGLFGAYTFYRNAYPEAWRIGSLSLDENLGFLNTVVLLLSSYTIVLSVSAARKGKNVAIAGWLVATMLLGFVFFGIKVVEYTGKYSHGLIPGKAIQQHDSLIRPFKFDYDHFITYAYEKAKKKKEAGKKLRANEKYFLEHYSPEALAKGYQDYKASDDYVFDPNPSSPDAHRHMAYPRGIQIYFALYFAMTGMHALHMVIGVGLMIWLILLCLKNTFKPEYYPHIEYFGLYWHFVDIVWIFLFPLLYLI